MGATGYKRCSGQPASLDRDKPLPAIADSSSWQASPDRYRDAVEIALLGVGGTPEDVVTIDGFFGIGACCGLVVFVGVAESVCDHREFVGGDGVGGGESVVLSGGGPGGQARGGGRDDAGEGRSRWR